MKKNKQPVSNKSNRHRDTSFETPVARKQYLEQELGIDPSIGGFSISNKYDLCGDLTRIKVRIRYNWREKYKQEISLSWNNLLQKITQSRILLTIKWMFDDEF